MKMEEEMNKAAEVLGLSLDEVKTKWVEIGTQHSLGLSETDKKLQLGLFRQWFGQQRRAQQTGTKQTSGGSLVNGGFGIIIGAEDCRDMMEYQRKNLRADYQRNAESVYRDGRVALVTSNEEGFQITQWLDGEETARQKDSGWEVPDSAMEIDSKWVIPVDNRASFGSGDKNRNYGKPLPKEQWVRRIHFVGEGNGGNSRYWIISLKDDLAKNFSAETYRFCHINGIWNAERSTMYGVKNQTAIVYNDELDPNHEQYRDTTGVDVQSVIVDAMGEKICPLIELERYHQENAMKPLSERLVLTDGVVMNMRLQPNATGNRTLFIGDLNAEFDYSGDGYSSVACWIPPHVNVEFGIGSHVIVLGRTNQREVDGELTPISLNVFGIYVVDLRGQPLEDEETVDEEDWF